MNSDEPQKSFSKPEQEPIVSAESEQRPEQEASNQTSDHEQEPSFAEKLPNQQSQGIGEEKPSNPQSVSAKPVESIEYLPRLKLNSSGKDVNQVESAQSSLEEEQGKTTSNLTQTVAELELKEKQLREKIASLQETQANLLSEQLSNNQALVKKMLHEGLTELEQRKQALQISVEQLERRRERIRQEMRSTFAGVSQDLAIRVQGFKDYLVGSLEDLVTTAEELELSPVLEIPEKPSLEPERTSTQKNANTPQFAEQGFQEQTKQIRNILDQYRTLPDYYGPSWQLRRTFEPIHAERVSNWFFSQGGRGPIRTMGSRLQNILVASAVISVLRTIEDERLRTLVLANTPERLGEWRRGLQDCLGISRSDFGPERGVVLFEEAAALVQKADRLITQKQLPLIIIDETEDQISLSLLQFPLWLAFAPDPQQMSPYQY